MRTKRRINKDKYFLEMARLVSTRATCPRRSVGCVLVDKHGHVLATGYNGVPRAYTHCIYHPCPGADLPKGLGLNKCMATHAEQNALLQCSDVMRIDTVYCTTSPCVTCAKLIGNTSAHRFVYIEDFTHTEGLELLTKLAITIEKVEL